MNRSPRNLTLGLAFAAAAAFAGAADAGEPQPLRPGLEVFDSVTPMPFPGTAGESGSGADQGDFYTDPLFPAPAPQPPYRPPEIGARAIPSAPAAPAPDAQAMDGYPADQFSAQPPVETMDPYADPFTGLDDGYGGAAAPGYAAAPLGAPGAAGAETPAVPPQAPLFDTVSKLNIANPYFPGLREAAAGGDLHAAGVGILDTLRRRRVVDATMARGVRGSLGASSPYEMRALLDTLARTPEAQEDPLAPAQRINVILDAFQQPFLDAPDFDTLMPGILDSLNRDIQQVRLSLSPAREMELDDGAFLELARTYVRAATTCDFFDFPRRELSGDVQRMVDRAALLFHPDGSSRGGDVAGITGNLFRLMFMMEHYTRDDAWFRRGIRGLWNKLERPAKYVLDVACPDFSLPRFGPRGSREMLPVEVEQLLSTFPPEPPHVTRIGLARTESHPARSGDGDHGGVYVMCDGRTAEGRYLAVRFGSQGDLVGVPTHEDFGSITLMTRGGKYLVDAGGYGGAAAGAPAHGGLSLDGQFTTGSTYSLPGEASDAIWRTNASLDYAADRAGFPDGKTWQRSVVFVKNLPGETLADYWMVLDQVDMKGDPGARLARIRYQLAPGAAVFQDGPGLVVTGGIAGTGVRMYAVDAGASLRMGDGSPGGGGQVFDASGGALPAPSVTVERQLTGDSTTATLLYPMDNPQHRPVRIERDSDIIRGRTGAIVIDHGLDRVDVVAWAPPGSELVTPTLNLQLSADLAVFRVRRGKIARIDFVNLERFQAKEPDGGAWSMRVNGPAQTLTIEPERGGGWQVLADQANRGAADFFDVNFGPVVQRRKFSIRPGEMRVLSR